MNSILDAIKKLLRSRNLKYGTNSFILVAAVVAIAVLINVLVGMADLKWDLTPNKIYSISDTTKEILGKLNKEVVIYGLFDDGTVGAGTDYHEVVELLDHYKKYPNVKVEYIDPDKNPGFIKEMDPENVKDLSKMDFIVKSGSRMKKLEYYDLFRTQFDQQTWQQYKIGSAAEQGFTGAIKYVTADDTPVVYFTEGHDEYELDGDYRNIVSYLDRNNIDAKSINLLTVPGVPEDAEMVIVGSPKRDFSGDEADKLNEYIKNGGKAILMFDFLPSDPEFRELNRILGNYNVMVNNDRVKENDQSRHIPDNPQALLLDVDSSGIFPQDFVLLLENSRSIGILKNEKEYITVKSLMYTSDQAIGEQVDKSRGQDINGPLDVAVTVEYKGGSKPAKLLVMGNGYFITDAAQNRYGANHFNNSLYFFLSSLNWAMDKKDEVIVPSKSYDNPRITINAMQSTVMGIVLVVVLPLAILGAGLFVFLRRRHL
jgi:ABC-2 type transport system permease protein